MSSTQLERMIALANNVFAAKEDPEQLQVDDTVINQLQELHPRTLSSYNQGDGPVIWVLLIPTTHELMDLFIQEKISECGLLDKTSKDMRFDTIYLCSALTLPEFRNKGLTKKLALEAIHAIRASYPIKALFVWNFTPEGANLAESISKAENLPLFERPFHRNIPE